MQPELRAGLPAWWALLLAAVVLTLYAPAVNYGLIWDDPRFYAGVRAQASVVQMFAAPQPPTHQFYRPLATLYNSWLITAEGVVNAPAAHVVQFAAHLIIVLGLGPLLCGLGLAPFHARIAALGFAIFPLSYFGVAWQQNQQPLMVMSLALSVLAAQAWSRTHARRWLAASLGLYAAALLFQEGALPFALVFLYLGWRDRAARRSDGGPRRWPIWTLGHITVAGVYALIWISMPLVRGVTGPGWQPIVLAYFAQGVVFPLAQLLTPWVSGWSSEALLALYLLLWAGLTAGVWRWASPEAAVFSWTWIWIAILPLWAGLSWEYARLGPRLLYPAAIGIAVLWAGWAAWTFTASGARRLVGAAALALVVGTSAYQLWHFQRLFQAGTHHLAEAVEVLSADPGRRLLFVNFPDQYEPRPALYALGFWGPVLAPPIEDLADYARALRGRSAEDRSLASFVTGDRGTSPYSVFMRGVDSAPAQLAEWAEWADEVYLSDYLPDGTFRLRAVGAIRAPRAAQPRLASFEGADAELINTEIAPDLSTVRLTWRCLKPLQPDDTIFVHVWQGEDYLGGADGDSLGGLIPPAAWPAGVEVVDVRPWPMAGLPPGTYQLRVGLYNRLNGDRYPTLLPNGSVSDVGVLIGEVRVPP